ncbi:MAG: endo alpha-1,4 polygalactosaminidase [Acidimicrobiia bacterium]|nr:endo alpha-1,4 polygalactosaminidase [Acidimicrobiia bacterium]
MRSGAIALLLLMVGCSDQVPEAGPWWIPPQETTWQIQLQGEIDTSLDVAVYEVDLFDTPQGTIDALHADGRRVICYFSAGSHEDWRSDADAFADSVLGLPLEGWPGERWLDIRRLDLFGAILEARLDLAADKGCDAVDPDNVEGYANPTGFGLTAADQLAFNRWLAAEAHGRGLGIGLKNDLAQIPDLVDAFDFAVNEECFAFAECGLLAPFLDAGKAVLAIDYSFDRSVCLEAGAMGLSLVFKEWDLGAELETCG